MFIEALSHLSALSEMLSISLNAEKSPVGVFAIYKHFAALRLYSDRLSRGCPAGDPAMPALPADAAQLKAESFYGLL